MQFTVEGKPQGKARAQTVRNKYTGKVHSYTPEKTASYEDLIRWSYREAGGVYYGDKELQVDIQAFYPIPKSFSKVKHKQAVEGIIKPRTKPDLDNVLKVVLDALNGVAFLDDKQIVRMSAKKQYGESPCIKITIQEANNV